MSGTISPRDRLQLWVNTFLLKQKENSGSVTATFRDQHPTICFSFSFFQSSVHAMYSRALPAHGRRGSRLGAGPRQAPGFPEGGSSAEPMEQGGARQSSPSSKEHKARWRATPRRPHQRRLHPGAAAVQRTGGARRARSRTRRRTKVKDSAFRASSCKLRVPTAFAPLRTAERDTISVSGPREGAPPRVRAETRVASQHHASPCGEAPCTISPELPGSRYPTSPIQRSNR